MTILIIVTILVIILILTRIVIIVQLWDFRESSLGQKDCMSTPLCMCKPKVVGRPQTSNPRVAKRTAFTAPLDNWAAVKELELSYYIGEAL